MEKNNQTTEAKSGKVGEYLGSGIPYRATEDSQFVKGLHGRGFNTISDSYILPSDQTEWSRLDKQGAALTIGFGGLYPCPEIVEAVLIPVEGNKTRIVDIGCGTGAWAMQMATKFPEALVLGLDVAPSPIDPASMPPNLTLEIYDINRGLAHLADQMDLVHMRCVTGGISDIDKTLEELQLSLKPGGLLLVVDGDSWLLSEGRATVIPLKQLPGDPNVSGVSEHGSWWRRISWEAIQACEIGGASVPRSDEVDDLGLWDFPVICDPETARSGGVDFPVGPWLTTDDEEETKLLRYVGELMSQNLKSAHRAFHAMMRRYGMDQATLDDWSMHADEEIETLNPKLCLRFRFFMARRRAGDGLPAPPLRSLPPTTEQETNSGIRNQQEGKQGHVRYPFLDVYSTREENMKRMVQRRTSIGVVPPSIMRKAWEKLQAES